jgi:hypothetical protein
MFICTLWQIDTMMRKNKNDKSNKEAKNKKNETNYEENRSCFICSQKRPESEVVRYRGQADACQ